MHWFGYVWIVILALAYVIWTIKCVRDFIDDFRGIWPLSAYFNGSSWGWWIVIHLIVLIASSLAYFLLMKVGVE